MKSLFILISFVVFTISGGLALADCPSADLNGDFFVDFADFAVIGAQWLNVYDWNDVNTLSNQWLTTEHCVPDDMVYIAGSEFEMGDSFSEGNLNERPVHTVTLDSFYMGKYEVTNAQYCDYLNSTYDACDIKVDGGIVYGFSDSSNSYPYCDTYSYDGDSQIDYNDVSGTFSVRAKGEPPRDMSDDPMVQVSWYGSVAYCNWLSSEEGYESCYDISIWDCNFSKQGYRLATEAEWEYAAHSGFSSNRFPWGDTVTHSQTNYYADPCCYSYDVNPTSGYHPDWDDGIYPYTSPAGSFSANGFGVYDMAGNVWEWCNDWYSSTYYSSSPPNNPTGPTSGTCRVLRGGSWYNLAYHGRVLTRINHYPYDRSHYYGFRLCLDF